MIIINIIVRTIRKHKGTQKLLREKEVIIACWSIHFHMESVNNDLYLQASDGLFTSNCSVNITVLDVNNNVPLFQRQSYVSTVKEDTPIGMLLHYINR